MSIQQSFTSKGTSINCSKLPRAYRFVIPAGAVVVDYGCGRYTEHLQRSAIERGWTWYGYDPFNRTDAENRPAVDVLQSRSADFVICSNVLNVIDSDAAVNDVIRAAADAAKIAAVFTVYEGNGTGTGKQTGPDAFQRNEKRAAYVDRIESIGYKAARRGDFIIVTK